MILALDTSTHIASIAIYGGEEGVVSEITWRSLSHHTVELAPYLDLLLRERKELAGIVVALGPGSFTGLRVGLSLAKGFALAQQIPLIGVPTLDALAYSQSHQPLPICALLQAGRGRICAALYEEGTLHRVTDYLLTTIEGLCPEITRPTLVCGEIDEVGRAILRERLGDRAVVASLATSLRRAGYLAEMGWERLQRGEVDAPRTLEPLYLPRPEIPKDGL